MLRSARVGVLWSGAAIAIAIASVAAVAAGPRGVRAPSSPQTIAIDFFAVGPDGAPASDLSAADIAISLAGRPTPIRSLEWVRESALADPDEASGRLPTRLPAPFATNVREPGARSFYLVVDDDAADGTFVGALAASTQAFLSALPSRDLVALSTVRTGGPSVPSTADRSAVTAALTSWHLPAPSSKTDASPGAKTSRDAARVTAVLDAIAGSDTTSIVVLVGRGSPFDNTNGTADVTAMRRAEARARAHVFQADVAAGTGGRDALARIARETTAHYVAAVAGDDSTGPVMPITMTASRAGVSLIARPLATVGLEVHTGGDPSITAAVNGRDEFRQATLRASAFSSRAARATGKTALAVVIESGSGKAPLVGAGAALFDSAGSIVATGIAPPSAVATAPVTCTLVVPPGRYRLRAVGSVVGNLGSVDAPIDVGLTAAGQLRLGSLAVGVAHRAPTAPARGGRALDPPVPDIQLQFSDERDAIAFFDLYGGTANERVTVLFEVRRRPDGPPIALLQPTIQPARLGEPDHYLVTAPIDLASLAPGDYEIRATVSAGGQTAGVITRTLRRVKAA